MSAFLRVVFVLPLGFVLAVSAAGFAMLWPFFQAPPAMAADPVFWIEAALVFGAQVAQIGSAVLLPWCVFVLVSELLGWNGVLFHLAAGLLGGFALVHGAYGGIPEQLNLQTAFLVAALVFSLVYWVIAGRTAGGWRRRRATRSPAE